MKLILQLFVLLMGFSGNVKAQETMQAAETPPTVEWVDITRDDGSEVSALVVYPEIGEAVKAVMVIHDKLGLNQLIKDFSVNLAGQGFLVIAPDLISNRVEGIAKTTDFVNSEKVREAIYALDDLQVTKDMDLVYDFVKNNPLFNGKISVVGLGWGGSQSFGYATQNPDLESTIVYYGTAPKDLTSLKNIQSPVFGFYGAADNRVIGTIPDTEKTMKEYGKPYTFEIYESVGHAFMSRGAEETYGPNNMAYEKSWNRLITLLK